MVPEADSRGSKRRPSVSVKLALVILAVSALVVVARRYNLQEALRDALTWIDSAGAAGPLVFFALYVAACVFMLPGSVLTLGAGVVFGVVKGSALVSISSTVGATVAFLVGRYLARDVVARRLEGNPTFRAVDEAVASEGWKIVGLTRLSPVFPFNLLNYAFGLTRVPLRDYVLASWLGMIPGTVMYVYLGSLAGGLADLGTREGASTRSAAEWTLYGVGLAATVAVTVVITRIARRALAQRMTATENRRSGGRLPHSS